MDVGEGRGDREIMRAVGCVVERQMSRIAGMSSEYLEKAQCWPKTKDILMLQPACLIRKNLSEHVYGATLEREKVSHVKFSRREPTIKDRGTELLPRVRGIYLSMQLYFEMQWYH